MNRLRVAAAGALATAAFCLASAQQIPTRSVRLGVYSDAQAGQGKTLYEQKCASCHGSMASVTPDMAPLLNDHAFQMAWQERSLAQLFERIRDTMPQNEPGTLTPPQTVQIIAYILSANNVPAGDMALAEDLETLRQIRLDAAEP